MVIDPTTKRQLDSGPYLCVDRDGTEVMFEACPIREVNHKGYWTLATTGETKDNCIVLPQGTIERLIGKELTWKNKPHKLVIKK
jgi:hypothetical protein